MIKGKSFTNDPTTGHKLRSVPQCGATRLRGGELGKCSKSHKDPSGSEWDSFNATWEKWFLFWERYYRQMTPFGRPLIKFYLEKNPVITLYEKKEAKHYKKNYKL
jgi:hypothetical protein